MGLVIICLHLALKNYGKCIGEYTINAGEYNIPYISHDGSIYGTPPPPKFNSLPLKIDGWKMSFLFWGAMLNVRGVYLPNIWL